MFIEQYQTRQGLSPAMNNGIGQILAMLIANSPNRQADREAQGNLRRAQAETERMQAQELAMRVAKQQREHDDRTTYDLAEQEVQRRLAAEPNRPRADVLADAYRTGAPGGGAVPLAMQALIEARLPGAGTRTEAEARDLLFRLNAEHGRTASDNVALTQDEILRRETAKRNRDVELARIAAAARAPAERQPPTLNQQLGTTYRTLYDEYRRAGDSPEAAARKAGQIVGSGGGGGGSPAIASREAGQVMKDAAELLNATDAALIIRELSNLTGDAAPFTGVTAGVREFFANTAQTGQSILNNMFGDGKGVAPSPALASTQKLRYAAQIAANHILQYLKPASDTDLHAAAKAVGNGTATPEQLRAVAQHVLDYNTDVIRQEIEALQAAVGDPRTGPVARGRAKVMIERLSQMHQKVTEGSGQAAPGAPAAAPAATPAAAPAIAPGIPRYNPLTGDFE